MLATIPLQVPAFSIILLFFAGLLIGCAIATSRREAAAPLDDELSALRLQNLELHDSLRIQRDNQVALERQLTELRSHHDAQLEHSRPSPKEIRHDEHGVTSLELGATLEAIHELRTRAVTDLEAEKRRRTAAEADLTILAGERAKLAERLHQLEAERETWLVNQKADVETERDNAIQLLNAARREIESLHQELESHQRTLATIERHRLHAGAKEMSAPQPNPAQTKDTALSNAQGRADRLHEELEAARGQIAILRAQMHAASEDVRIARREQSCAVEEAASIRQECGRLMERLLAAERDTDRIRADREETLVLLRDAQMRSEHLTRERDLTLSRSDRFEPAAETPGDQRVRIQELEESVASLREQLRMALIRAQENVQRRLEDAGSPRAMTDLPSTPTRQLRRDDPHLGGPLPAKEPQSLLHRLREHNAIFESQLAHIDSPADVGVSGATPLP